MPADASMQERDPEEVPRDLQREHWAGAHPRAAHVLPSDRHHGELVPAAACEVDELDVEDDRCDLLTWEEVLCRLAGEALEAALGVLDVADDPDRREQVEQAAERTAVGGLRRPHVGTVRLDPAAER